MTTCEIFADSAVKCIHRANGFPSKEIDNRQKSGEQHQRHKVPEKSKEIQQKNRFDEQTTLQLKSLLDEIDRKQQASYQNTEIKYIKFGSDRERKALSFTGNGDKRECRQQIFKQGLKFQVNMPHDFYLSVMT